MRPERFEARFRCPLSLTASKVRIAHQDAAGTTALMDLPSPLAGEGDAAVQQQKWVRGRGRNPSPSRVCCAACVALSRKGNYHLDIVAYMA